MPKPNFKKVTFLCMQQLTNFPYIEEDFDALTNYELLSKVVEYLNKVIANENEQNESIIELYNSFNDLKNYVDNYFKNLDVQDEINNKLDDMVEAGTLQEIIANYLNSKAVFGYDNVADMKLATNLINGSYAKTLGYHTKNDGGEATYKIRTITNDDVVDEMFIISLADDDLIAELIVDSPIKPEQIGAYGDGTLDDTTVLQKCIDNADSIYLTKNYLITNSLVLKENVEIYGNENSTISTTNDMPLFIGYDIHHTSIKNLKLNKRSGENYHIEFSGYFVTINNCEFIGTNFDSSNYVNGINNIETTEGVSSFCNNISNNIIRNGQIKVKSTDGWIKDNIIWTATNQVTPDTYAVEILNDSWDINGNQIVGGLKGGLYYKGKQTGNLINILNNYFDGSYNTVLTGTHITLENSHNTANIQNNKFYNGYKNSINLINSYYVLINNNTFFNNNRSNSNIAEINIGEYQYGNRISISNNMFQNVSNQNHNLINLTGKGNIIFHDNIIHGNYITNKNYVNTMYFNSKGNIFNGVTYQRINGVAQNLKSDRYGLIFEPEVYTNSLVLSEIQVDGTTVNDYNVAKVNEQFIVYKVSSAELGKIITCIVAMTL